MVAPFFGQVEETGEPPHKMQSDDRPAYQINGSMTLHEVEAADGRSCGCDSEGTGFAG